MVLELIGYAASALVAVSLMMRSVLRLRVINLVGSLAFTAYGFLIGAYPVAAVNLFIVFINLYYLREMLGAREYFRLVEVVPDSEYLRYFLDFNAADIRRFLPGFSYAPAAGQLRVFVLRGLVPAGLFIGRVEEGGRLRVDLDYVVPHYRDFRTGRYLFGDEAAFFRARGIREIVSEPGNAEHREYLEKMGFAPGADGLYRLAVP